MSSFRTIGECVVIYIITEKRNGVVIQVASALKLLMYVQDNRDWIDFLCLHVAYYPYQLSLRDSCKYSIKVNSKQLNATCEWGL